MIKKAWGGARTGWRGGMGGKGGDICYTLNNKDYKIIEASKKRKKYVLTYKILKLRTIW